MKASCGQLCELAEEIRFVSSGQTAQVQTQCAICDAADHRHRQPAQHRFDFMQHTAFPGGRPYHQRPALQPVDWE